VGVDWLISHRHLVLLSTPYAIKTVGCPVICRTALVLSSELKPASLWRAVEAEGKEVLDSVPAAALAAQPLLATAIQKVRAATAPTAY
jgi:hypothetical protein